MSEIISIEDTVTKLQEKLLEEGYSQQEAKRIIYRELMKEGISFKDISAVLNKQMTTTTTKNLYEESSPYYGCPTDDDGYAIDPITREEIPEHLLISYTDGKHKYCFNKNTLYRLLKTTGSKLNPLNKQPLPKFILDEIKQYGSKNRIKVRINDDVLVLESYTTIGELILDSIRLLDGNLIEDVTEYDVLSDNISLYTLNLNDTIPESLSDLHTSNFQSLLHKNDSLSLMFDFSKQRRGTSTYDTLYSHLGSVLLLSPVVRVKNGLNYNVPQNAKIIDVILICYEFLGGIENIHDYNIVLENGKSLALLGVNRLAVEVIPSEEIYHVPYSDETKKLKIFKKIRAYAVVHNMRRLAEECVYWVQDHQHETETLIDVMDDEETLNHLINSGSYTLKEIEDYAIASIRLGKQNNIIIDPEEEDHRSYERYESEMIQHYTNIINEGLSISREYNLQSSYQKAKLSFMITCSHISKLYLESIIRDINVEIIPNILMPYVVSLMIYDKIIENDELSLLIANKDYEDALKIIGKDKKRIIGRTDDPELFKVWLQTSPYVNDERIQTILRVSIQTQGHRILNQSINLIGRKKYLVAITLTRDVKLDQFKNAFIGTSEEEYKDFFLISFKSSFINDEQADFLLNDDRTTSNMVNIAAMNGSKKLKKLIEHPLFTAHKSLLHTFAISRDINFRAASIKILLENVSDEFIYSLGLDFLKKLMTYPILEKYLTGRGITL